MDNRRYDGTITIAGSTYNVVVGDPYVDENFDTVFIDLDGDGIWGENAYDHGTAYDNRRYGSTRMVDEDIRIRNTSIKASSDTWVWINSQDNVTTGADYIRYDYLAAHNVGPTGTENEVRLMTGTYFRTRFYIDANDDGVTDNVHFCLLDTNSDGTYDTVDISVGAAGATAAGDTYGQNIISPENILTVDNDARITAATTLQIGSAYDYSVIGPVAYPENTSPDFSVTSTSWWFGLIVLDIDGDGVVDDNVNFCLSDNDSNGVFNVLDISAYDNTYGQGTLDNNILDNLDDERITATDNIRIGPIYDYTVTLVGNPAATGYDYRVTSRSWYIGTITLHADENFNFVIWDPDSDGVFENLVFDDNRDGSYSGDPQYDNFPVRPVRLPRDSRYGYEVLWFNRNPATSVDLRMQPVDVASPAFSDPSPAAWVAVSTRTPTISVVLNDVGAEGITFGIDPATIIMRVRGDVVPHTYSAGVVSWQGYLYDGPVQVRVEARDYAENPVTVTEWTFTVDTAKPVITIVEPQPFTVTGSPNILLKGKVTDLTWATVQVQGEEVAVVDGTFEEWITLSVGKNTITVRATDQAGNVATSELTMTYEPELAPPGPPEEFPTEQVILIAVVGIAVIIALIALFVKRS